MPATARSICLMGSSITDALPPALVRPGVNSAPRRPVPSVAFDRIARATMALRREAGSPLVRTVLAYADAVFDAAEELRGAAQRTVTAFQLKYSWGTHGGCLVLSREFAHEYLLGERGFGLNTDEEALEMRAAIEAIVNEGLELEDSREDEYGPGYPREWYPAIADECEWFSDAGWQQMADAAVAAE